MSLDRFVTFASSTNMQNGSHGDGDDDVDSNDDSGDFRLDSNIDCSE